MQTLTKEVRQIARDCGYRWSPMYTNKLATGRSVKIYKLKSLDIDAYRSRIEALGLSAHYGSGGMLTSVIVHIPYGERNPK